MERWKIKLSCMIHKYKSCITNLIIIRRREQRFILDVYIRHNRHICEKKIVDNVITFSLNFYMIKKIRLPTQKILIFAYKTYLHFKTFISFINKKRYLHKKKLTFTYKTYLFKWLKSFNY